MSSPFPLSLVTPEGAQYTAEITSVSVPGEQGSFGILNRHAPIVSKLTSGVVKIRQADKVVYFAVGSGVLEVDHHSHCLLLVDYALKAESANEARDLLKQSR